jgi:hypothetical protein
MVRPQTLRKPLVRDWASRISTLFEAVCRGTLPSRSSRRSSHRRLRRHQGPASRAAAHRKQSLQPPVGIEGLEERVLLTISPTLTALSVPTTAALVGQPLSFTANVTLPGAPSAAPSGGVVTFMDGDVCLGTAPLVGGKASLTNSLFTTGEQVVTASYNGSAAGLAGSTSAGHDLSVTNDASSNAVASSFAMPCYVSSSGASPMQTAGPTGMTPTQIRQAYGFNNVSFGSQAANGLGSTIAIVDAYDDPNIANDLTAFDTQFDLPAPPTFTKVNQTGGSTFPAADAGWITEIALDVEWSHAVAPGANILLVEANSNNNSDLYAAVDYARHAAGVVAVSMSWGEGESSSETTTDSYFTTPSGHAGVTFLASSGDGGAPPIYPSISPNVVSVGGTSLYLTAQNAYSSETGWYGSGGGISSYEAQPAYQDGVVAQSTTYRTDPDISYDADPDTGFPVYDSYNNGTVTPWGQWGGTSDAAPQWAALVAIADQGRALAGEGSLNGVTQTLPILYAAPQSDFHDVTSGTSEGYPEYSAGPGYDLVTGRGTPYANQIIHSLINPNGLTNTTLGVSASTITYGQSVTLTATVSVVAPGTGTPSGGTVTFLDYGTAIGSAPLTDGTAAFTTSTLNYGSHELTCSYGGDGTTYWPSSTASAGLSSASIVTTVAGEGIGDGNAATAAILASPRNVALDSAGDLFIADTSDNRVREVNHATGLITTVAGTGTAGYNGDGGQATAAELSSPYAVALDSGGNLYIADTSNDRVRKVNLSTGVVTTIAGDGSYGYSGDGGQATTAELYYPRGIALDGSGDLFIADYYNNRIRKVVLSSGIITTVAGTGATGYNGDGIQATAATLYYPEGVAVDSVGNFYIADYENDRIRKVTVSSGQITTVAGTGTAGYSGDGAAATLAKIYLPWGVAVDSSGNLFIADYENNRIREVYASNGTIATVAGTGTSGFSGDGAVATAAKLAFPTGVGVDSSGNIYIADCNNNRIREVNHSTGFISTFAGGYIGDGSAATAAVLTSPYGTAVDSSGDIFIADTSDNRVREINHATGVITTVAGTGTAGYSGDGSQATAAMLSSPRGVALDSAGNLYIADCNNNRIREVNFSTGVITTIAGNGVGGYAGDGGQATSAEIWDPYAIALDGSGDLFIADYGNQRIREVKLSSGVITTIAGGGTGDGQAATAAPLNYPENVAVDSAGNLYIADFDNNRVRKVNHATDLITTVAGTGTAGYNGDGGQATAAELSAPYAVALDSAGNLYIADSNNERVRKVNLSTGVITTIAGNGSYGYSGDGGQATTAEFEYLRGIALDGSGDLFIADYYNNRIRKVVLSSGIITTVAGTGTTGYNGDGIQATAATLYFPEGVAVDSSGNLYIADYDNNRIREVLVSSGLISTVAGNGTAGYSGDNGAATAAEVYYPEGVAVGAGGNLFIADTDNCRIREVYASNGTIATVAGSGGFGYSGDGKAATAADLADPCGVAVDSAGNLYIADTDNYRIREVSFATNLISTVAGNGFSAYGGDGGAATAAVLSRPTGVAVDPAGNLYIADSSNQRVRRVNLSNDLITTVAGTGSAGSSGDGGAATAAAFDSPQGVAVDSAGNLYVADYYNNRVREINFATGIVTTIAGGSARGFGGDGGPASAALLTDPSGVAIDSTGNLYIADSGNNRIREIAVGGGTLVVGSATASSTSLTVSTPPAATYGGSVPLSATLLCGGIPVSGESILFTFNGSFLSLGVTNANGVAFVSAASVAGIVPKTYPGDLDASFAGTSLLGTSSAAATLTITAAPLTIAAENASKVYGTSDPTFSATCTGFASGEGPANLGGTLAFATSEPASGFAPGGTYAISPSGLTSSNYAITFVPGTLTVTAATTSTTLSASTTSSVYGQSVTLTATVAAAAPSAATPTGGTVTFMVDGTTLATAALSGGTASLVTTAITAGTHGLSAVYNGDGVDFSTSAASSLTGATITTFAGNGTAGYSGDGGAATSAELSYPSAIATDASGDLFIADYGNNCIREVNSSGVVTTIAGNGTDGYAGDGGQATAAELADPSGVFVDASGRLFIADAANNRVREVNLSTGVITTVAGDGIAGYAGDGGLATLAMIDAPQGLTENGSGQLFISDCGNQRIRAVNLSTGLITTVAGNGTAGYAGDGGLATAGELNSPMDIALDASGNLFIADQGNYRVRDVNLATGMITTVAGNGIYGYGGDGGPAIAAEISAPIGIAVDSTGNLIICDNNNSRIREVNRISGAITTVAGNGAAGYAGDGGQATAAEICLPHGIAMDSGGRLFIADSFNNCIRVVTPLALAPALNVSPAPLTITAISQSKIYGAALPTLGASYVGLVNADTAASLTTAPTLITTATNASHVGSYAITVGGAVDSNYTIGYGSGTLTVTPAPLTISADNKTKPYGAALPTLTITCTGFVNGDTSASLTTAPIVSTTATIASHVSGNPYVISVSGATEPDYAITYVAGAVTVTPVPLTITADDKSAPYGAGLPVFTASYSGLANGDTAATLSTAPSFTSTATAASHVSGSPYAINVSGAADTDYTFNYVPGTLIITPVPLTITVDNKTKLYGAALPIFTASYSGLANGDTAASLSIAPAFATTASASSPAGSYPITASGALDADYTITCVSGTLTINADPLTITAVGGGKVYGRPDPTFSASYWGFVPGDGPADLGGTLLFTTNEPAGNAPVGSYTVTPSGLTSANYTITFATGTLLVCPTPLIVMANGASKCYGSPDPAFSVTCWGCLPGDNAGDLGGTLSFVTNEPSSGNASVGNYQIAPGGLTCANYAISFVTGTLTVKQAAPTISVIDAGGTYNGSPFPATATVTGASGSPVTSLENVSPTLTYYVGSTASGSGASTAPSAVGTYTVVASFAGSTDYALAQSNPLTFSILANQVATPGLYDPTSSWWSLRNSNTTGGADIEAGYGPAGGNWMPLVGDWTGNGIDTIGLYNPATGYFYLRNSNTTGAGDITFFYGDPSQHWIPVVGDWTGQKSSAGYPIDSVGMYDPTTCTWYLRNELTTGVADITIGYGPAGAGWLPLVGDWTGNGIDTVGLYNAATGYFYLRNSNTTGAGDIAFFYGNPTQHWLPVAGDWTGAGHDSIGMYDPATGTWYLRNELSTGVADETFGFGPAGAGWLPVVGHWADSSGTQMLSAGALLTSATVSAPLSQAAPQSILAAAIVPSAAGGTSSTPPAATTYANCVASDMPNAEPGQVGGNTANVAQNTAGQGSFIDPTVAADMEFTRLGSGSPLPAVDPRAVDYVAGLDNLDSSATSLLSGQLPTGVQRLPGANEVDAILAEP